MKSQSQKIKRTLTIFQYLNIIQTIGIALLLIIGVYTATKMGEIRQLAESVRYTQAQLELKGATDNIINFTRQFVRETSHWDSTYQQLSDPSDYPFWRKATLMNPARVPYYIEAMDLYDEKGKILAADALEDMILPRQLPKAFINILREESIISLQLFSPLLHNIGKKKGYVGVRINLLEALSELNTFLDLAPSQISFSIPANISIKPEQISEYISFEFPEESRYQTLVSVMQDGLVQITLAVTLLLLSVAMIMRFLIVKPLHELGEELRTMEGTEQGLRYNKQKKLRVRELADLVEALDRHHACLHDANAKLDSKNRQLWDLARTDVLTGVGNRLAMNETWDELINDGQAPGRFISAVMFDCDNFKDINDTHGHETGDRLLQQLATILQETIRESDLLFRLGGDEFIALLLNTGEEEAQTIAQRCLEQISNRDYSTFGVTLPIGMSIGIACCKGMDKKALSNLGNLADAAMYKAKNEGGNRIVLASA